MAVKASQTRNRMTVASVYATVGTASSSTTATVSYLDTSATPAQLGAVKNAIANVQARLDTETATGKNIQNWQLEQEA